MYVRIDGESDLVRADLVDGDWREAVLRRGTAPGTGFHLEECGGASDLSDASCECGYAVEE